MNLQSLKLEIKKLYHSNCMLLWLEGTRHYEVKDIKIINTKLIVKLDTNTFKLVTFDRYAVTSVGLQFWNKGKPSVLYRWDSVEKRLSSKDNEKIMVNIH